METIPFASRLLRFPADKAFIRIAVGDGMLPKIKSGDILIYEKSTEAKNGQIISCLVNGMPHTKVYWKSVNGDVTLCRLYGQPIMLADTDEFIIEGILRNIFSYE